VFTVDDDDARVHGLLTWPVCITGLIPGITATKTEQHDVSFRPPDVCRGPSEMLLNYSGNNNCVAAQQQILTYIYDENIIIIYLYKNGLTKRNRT